MKEKCKIIQDLLPNYIEGLTNQDTNKYIDEHLKECEECQKVLSNMQKEIELNNSKRENREVNYIKKFNQKMKMLKLLLLLIMIISIIILGRRAILVYKIMETSKVNIVSDNYYVKRYSYNGNSMIITETYNMGENYLTTRTRYLEGNENIKLTYYKKDGINICLLECGEKKYMLNSENTIAQREIPETYMTEDLFANLKNIFIEEIGETYCNGKKCYVIKGKSYERYIDKETGIAVRNIEKSNEEIDRTIDTVVDYEYQFDVVKDSDIMKPDISDFVKER